VSKTSLGVSGSEDGLEMKCLRSWSVSGWGSGKMNPGTFVVRHVLRKHWEWGGWLMLFFEASCDGEILLV
jgi:hypothetical protein